MVRGRITEATEDELFEVYLKKELDDIIDFPTFLRNVERAGCVIEYNKKKGGNGDNAT